MTLAQITYILFERTGVAETLEQTLFGVSKLQYIEKLYKDAFVSPHSFRGIELGGRELFKIVLNQTLGRHYKGNKEM